MPRVEFNRLRWRMRGAWLWPAFGLATVAGALVLELLPVWGDGPGGLVPALLLSATLNLVVMALLAPVGGLALRRRRRDLPRAVAADYAGTALLGALFAGLVIGGLAHRDDLQADEVARERQAFAVARFVRAQEPAFAHSLASMDVLRVEPSMFRTCIPGQDPERPLCLFVRTDQDPPAVTRDPDRAPNQAYRLHGGFE